MKRLRRFGDVEVGVGLAAVELQLREERAGELLRADFADRGPIMAEQVESEFRKRRAVHVGEFDFDQDLSRVAHLQHVDDFLRVQHRDRFGPLELLLVGNAAAEDDRLRVAIEHDRGLRQRGLEFGADGCAQLIAFGAVL